MKKWETISSIGIFLVVIACILLLWAFQGLERIDIYSEHQGDLIYCFGPLLYGLLLFGFGVALLAVTYVVYKLEKQIAQ